MSVLRWSPVKFVLTLLSTITLENFFDLIPSLTYNQVVVQKKLDSFYYSRENTKVFDFIIVGGGSAGSVIANRLSLHFNVLLLEAGGDPTILNYIPSLDLNMLGIEGDWRYRSLPQAPRAALACFDSRPSCSKGKSLGGSSNLNAMFYIRGNAKSYDQWSELTGDDSWSYLNVLPLFKKSEKYEGNFPNAAFHGTRGELYVSKSEFSEFWPRFRDFVGENGYEVKDCNTDQVDCFMSPETTTYKGLRWSTYSAFLEPILKRRSLTIWRFSEVTKILIENKRAFGVEYKHLNDPHLKRVFARKEVVVCAGPINSPKLLMLSGIGKPEDLNSHNIDVIQSLPVGYNLQDHPVTALRTTFEKEFSSFIIERDSIPDALNVKSPNLTRVWNNTPLSTNFVNGVGFFSSAYNDDPNWPDIQAYVTFLGVSRYYYRPFVENLYIKPLDLDHENHAKDGNLILVNLVRTKSRGTVKLNDTDPIFGAPFIDPAYFTDLHDMDALTSGTMRFVNELKNSQVFKDIGIKVTSEDVPVCAHEPKGTKQFWECYIRHYSNTIWHHSGTCKMGKISDPTAVVDPQLRVIGIKDLRVCDSSIMPVLINGNPNAPTMMIGEKCSNNLYNMHK